jgi:tripartite-type tricarboxylate transporter receptor subunit TctC
VKLPRRLFLHLAAGVAALPAMPHIASALDYPTRSVHLIVGFAAGGTQDTVARLVAQWLTNRLGRQFVVENKPGAGGNVAAEAVVRSPADGYTLLMVGFSNAVNATLYRNLGFNFIRDIAPIASIVRLPNVLVVHPSVPAKTVPELIAYAKENPGRVTFASAGVGSPNHLACELFKMMAGVDVVHVPYRGGGAAITDLLGGHVLAMFESIPVSIEHIKARELRALAVTTPARLDALPDIRPVADFVPGFEITANYGVGAPNNTPAAIIDKLNGEINAGLADADMQARFAKLGGTALPGSPADFGKLIADETVKWGKVIRATGIKGE